MKKHNVVRLIALSLLAALSFTSCAGNEASQTVSETPTSGAAQETDSSAVTDDMSVKYTIDAVICQSPFVKDINTNAYTQWIEEQLNIDLVLNPIINSEFTDKINIMMSTGEYPELCLSKGQFTQVALYGPDEGVIIPLDEYITEELTPNLLARDKELNGYLDSMRELDGKIYAFGAYIDTLHVYHSSKMWYYKPILDETGLSVPTTTDEFYEVLKAIKEKNPDYIPLTGYTNSDPFNYLSNAFLYTSGAALQLWNDNGTVKSAITEDAYREALKYVNKLYAEGLLYSNTFSQTQDQVQAIANNEANPVVGFVSSLTPLQIWPSTEENALSRKVEALTPLKGPEGVQYALTTVSPYVDIKEGSFFITTEMPEEKRARAVRIMDLLVTDEAWYRTYGIEGKHWEYSEEGAVGIDDKTPAVIKSFTGWDDKTWGEDNASWCNFYPCYWSNDLRMSIESPKDVDVLSAQGLEKRLHTVTTEQYIPYGARELTLPKIRFSVDENNQMSQKQADLQKYEQDCRVAFITGSMDINDDSVWESYLAQLDQMGLKDVIEMYQMGYDRQYKNK